MSIAGTMSIIMRRTHLLPRANPCSRTIRTISLIPIMVTVVTRTVADSLIVVAVAARTVADSLVVVAVAARTMIYGSRVI